jgi:hypothetical protein
MKIANLPLIGAFVPGNAVMTVDRAENGTPIRYSVDAVTETKMQRQRLVAAATGPLVVWAGWKHDGRWSMKLLLMGMGTVLTAANLSAYMTVRKAQKEM